MGDCRNNVGENMKKENIFTADKVFVCGDVHGNFELLNSKLRALSDDNQDSRIIVIQCGDFGYFWDTGTEEPEYFRHADGIITIPENITFIWTPGNHENWDALNPFGRGNLVELQDRLFLATFGTTVTINDEVFLFAPGADSIDKWMRTEKISWWRDEVITYADMVWFEENTPEVVDVVISHTCPIEMFPKFAITKKGNDPSILYLDYIFWTLRPKAWYFGHFHKYNEGHVEECTYKMLDEITNDGWITQHKKETSGD